MKHQNLNHEVILHSELQVKGKPKDGEKATYKSKVINAYFHQFNGDNNYFRVYITRDMIIDLAKQIEEIEKYEEKQVFMDLPY
jgi:predicted AAA+ superfamily ATPase